MTVQHDAKHYTATPVSRALAHTAYIDVPGVVTANIACVGVLPAVLSTVWDGSATLRSPAYSIMSASTIRSPVEGDRRRAVDI